MELLLAVSLAIYAIPALMALTDQPRISFFGILVMLAHFALVILLASYRHFEPAIVLTMFGIFGLGIRSFLVWLEFDNYGWGQERQTIWDRNRRCWDPPRVIVPIARPYPGPPLATVIEDDPQDLIVRSL